MQGYNYKVTELLISKKKKDGTTFTNLELDRADRLNEKNRGCEMKHFHGNLWINPFSNL